MHVKTIPAIIRPQVIELIRQNKKVQAVKLVQETTSWGLKNAKDAVDALIKALENE